MKQIFTILSLALVLMSCSKEVTRTDIGIIPQPASVEIYEGTFNAAGAAFEADALCETVLNAISTFENNLVALGILEGEEHK